MFGPVKIEDDRGLKVPLFDHREARGREDREAVAAAAGAARMLSGDINRWDVVGIFGPVLVCLLGFIVVRQVVGPAVKNAAVEFGIFAVLGFGAFGFSSGLTRWGASQRVRAAMLKVGRCASCGYALKEVEPQADGCSVCPECGAGWRMVK